MTWRLRAVLLVLLPLLAGACAHPHGRALQGLEHALAMRPSATAALEEWCTLRQLAPAPAIIAQVLPGSDVAPPEEMHALFDAGQALAYRHVRLMCGRRILSEAYNWYVPALLTPAMNQALAATDTPFGRVVAPLGFTRQRLAGKRGRLPGCPHDTILSHRALLRLPDGRPFSALLECYTPENLGQPEPR